MPHCESCDCFLDSENSILEHVEKVHGIHCRLGKPHEAYCETCHVYCGKKHKHASMQVLENHLRKKHNIDIQGAGTVSSDNVVS